MNPFPLRRQGGCEHGLDLGVCRELVCRAASVVGEGFVSTAAEQHAHQLGLALGRGFHQRRVTVPILTVDVDALLDEVERALRIADLCCVV